MSSTSQSLNNNSGAFASLNTPNAHPTDDNGHQETCVENKCELAFWICFGIILTLTGVYIIFESLPELQHFKHLADNASTCHITNVSTITINCSRSSYDHNCDCEHKQQKDIWIYSATVSQCGPNQTFTSNTQCSATHSIGKEAPCLIDDCNATMFEFADDHNDMHDIILQFVGGCFIILCGCCTYPCVLWLERKRRPRPLGESLRRVKPVPVISTQSIKKNTSSRTISELPALEEQSEMNFDDDNGL